MLQQLSKLTLALLAANAIMAIVVAAELAAPAAPRAGSAHDVEPPSAEPPEFGVTPHTPPAYSGFADMRERPLFFVDRRMPVPPTVAPPPPTPLRLTLEGVAMTAGSRVAVLRNTGNNQLLTLAEGAAHEGWVLEAIAADGARFSRGAEVTELPLEPDTSARGRR